MPKNQALCHRPAKKGPQAPSSPGAHVSFAFPTGLQFAISARLKPCFGRKAQPLVCIVIVTNYELPAKAGELLLAGYVDLRVSVTEQQTWVQMFFLN